MSIEDKQIEVQCDIVAGCGAVMNTIHPKDKDLGGFSVRRVLPNQAVKSIGPWIFFDHMGPANFPAGEGINVRPHPHINIATVTYLFDGKILHQDSIGSVQTIKPGDLNLMVTGSGMVHSERESNDIHHKPHSVHGLQLWMALPEEYEEIDPAFYHYSGKILPAQNINGVAVRVMIGEAFGITSPVKTFSSTLYIEAKLKAGQSLTLPMAKERGLYLVDGNVSLKDTQVEKYAMVVLVEREGIAVTANEDSQIVLIGGTNLGKRYIDWNFVSSRRERVDEAKIQWVNNKFPKISGDKDEYIPYPSKSNF